MVDKQADKHQIKKAVEEIYGVKVVSVNTMVYAGKLKSRFTKSGVITGRTNAFKKAVVTLNKGENIDFYSNI
jgi:large subunit ribosomal protein L23